MNKHMREATESDAAKAKGLKTWKLSLLKKKLTTFTKNIKKKSYSRKELGF